MRYVIAGIVVLLAVAAWARPPYYRGTPPHYPNPSTEPLSPFPYLRCTSCADFCADCHTH